jgi:hypothetical protein
MFYKSILNAVAVVVAVMAVMFVGCGSDDDGGGGSDLVGDWLIVGARYEDSDGNVEFWWRDDDKTFFSITSSQFTVIQFINFGVFWVEENEATGKYTVEGNSMCQSMDGIDGCFDYSISGNILTLSSEGLPVLKAERSDIAKFRSFLGSSIKSRDSKLRDTRWERESLDDGYHASISFDWNACHDSRKVYIESSSMWSASSALWYTEGSRLMLVSSECTEYTEGKCIAISGKIVMLDYELTNGNKTLRLRPDGSTEWDEWTLNEDDDYYFSQSKAKSEKGNGAIIPFWAFRR